MEKEKERKIWTDSLESSSVEIRCISMVVFDLARHVFRSVLASFARLHERE